MIPDKIYADGFGIYDEKPIFDENIEYIRKESLVEWAKNLYEKTMTFVQGDAIIDNALQLFALRISKHIESL